MRAAAKLMALVMVLAAREAGAADYSICWQEHYFGIVDADFDEYGSIDANGNPITQGLSREGTAVLLGPLGFYEVPFTATQGLVGFIVILIALIVLPIAVLATRRKKRAAR